MGLCCFAQSGEIEESKFCNAISLLASFVEIRRNPNCRYIIDNTIMWRDSILFVYLGNIRTSV